MQKDPLRRRLRFFIAREVLGISKTEFQVKLLSTAMHWFFASSKAISVIFALSFHLWTVAISFRENGHIAAVLTVFAPILAEIYWAFYITVQGTSEWFAYPVLLLIVAPVCYLLYDSERHDVSPRFGQ
jgi:hypothetical protein